MPRPRQPKGVPPRVQDARAYDRALRQAFLDPFIENMQARLALANATSQAYYALDQGLIAWQAQPLAGVPLNLVIESLNRVRFYNRERLFKTFRTALSIDIRPFLTEPAVNAHMVQAIADNVDLIKTIPPRYHDGLKERIRQTFMDAPFDQQRLKTLLQQEYNSSGYNLRRLTRDQTQKMNADLTEMRQGQLGIEEYVWQSSEDSRVRKTHADNNGKVFKWAEPPPITRHPGFDPQCRCEALPIITAGDRKRLTGGS